MEERRSKKEEENIENDEEINAFSNLRRDHNSIIIPAIPLISWQCNLPKMIHNSNVSIVIPFSQLYLGSGEV